MMALLGFVLGLVVGVAALLLNPLGSVGVLPALESPSATVKRFAAPAGRGMALDGAAFLLGSSAAPLADAANSRSRVAVMVLPAGDGSAAVLAVKVAVVSPQNSLWRARLGTLDSWVLFHPGEGSAFIAAYSNYWSVLRDRWLSGLDSGAAAEARYPLSALPPRGETVGVTGGSGAFAGMTGESREAYLPGVDGGAEAELQWSLRRSR
jgi:hypothetical protein